MDASQYKDYVSFMLFIKYISDKYGNSDDFAPPVIIPKGSSFTDMIALKGKPEIGDKISTLNHTAVKRRELAARVAVLAKCSGSRFGRPRYGELRPRRVYEHRPIGWRAFTGFREQRGLSLASPKRTQTAIPGMPWHQVGMSHKEV